jgi:hypothetical protein
MLAGTANAPGLGCTVAARRVGGLCGWCAGTVRGEMDSPAGVGRVQAARGQSAATIAVGAIAA